MTINHREMKIKFLTLSLLFLRRIKMILISLLTSLFFAIALPLSPIGVGMLFDGNRIAPIAPIMMAQNKSVDQECLVNGQLPPWVTQDPNHKELGLWQGELVEMSLNRGKPGDGSSDTCQYRMRLKSDPSVTWDCLGLSNTERSRKQGG